MSSLYLRSGQRPSIFAEYSRLILHLSLSQIRSQSSFRIFPRALSLNQLWQGTTFPDGVIAILERHAPQVGGLIPRHSQKEFSTHPGDVKLISIPFSLQYSTASFKMAFMSSVSSCNFSEFSFSAFPVVISPEQVTYKTPRECRNSRVFK